VSGSGHPVHDPHPGVAVHRFLPGTMDGDAQGA
jgi:hypothetical protein